MKRAVFRYIEAELYDYPCTMEEIEALRDSIIESTPILDGSEVGSKKKSFNKSDPTVAKTVQLLTNRRLKRMEETIKAIDKVLKKLPAEKRKLVKLRYWDCRLTDIGVAETLHISPATYYRWKKEIILAIAIEMGLTNAVQAV